jgi:C-terminal processing protease CtpA/Prc
MNKKVTFTVLVSVLVAAGFSSCKKESKSGGTTKTTTAITHEDSLKYLMYHTMQVSYADGGRSTSPLLPTYFWYSNVPTLDPVSSTYETAEDLLEVMKGYAKGTGSTVLDRYSFLDRTGDLNSQLQDGVSGSLKKVSGTSGDFGFEVSFARDANNKSYLFVLYADKNSPAGKAGLGRGDLITAINGDTALSYDGSTGAHVKKVVDAIYNSTAVALTVRKVGTSSTAATTSYNLATTSYNINPVLYDTVYTINGVKTGYFVFYTYTNVYTSTDAASPTKTVLDALFAKFKSEGISNLVVDLRYNGGGSVTTAEYLDSVIAPASAGGKPMYYYTYNDKLTANLDRVGLEASVNFPANTGGFSFNNVVFIVSNNTASASELTLNNLKPYMNVKLVGQTTYGKPVGFITFTLNDHDSTGKENYLADLYAINFATENSAHVGGYYSGITVDQTASDYIDVAWGDDRYDENLYQALYYATNGSFAASSARRVVNNSNKERFVNQSLGHKFNGMVDFRIGKQLK